MKDHKRPLSYYQKRDYIIDEAFFEEYKNEVKEENDNCVLCGKPFIIGEDGNELGFCIRCQKNKDFPYDLDKYYKDHDKGKTTFKGFETMNRGILERYRR